jgi:hypothetical protein
VVNNIPTNRRVFDAFPNPFRDDLNIRFSLEKENNVLIKILSLLGELATKPLEQKYEHGIHNCRFDLSHLPAGVYICKIEMGETIEHKLVVKQ